jgi:hypothetical protein
MVGCCWATKEPSRLSLAYLSNATTRDTLQLPTTSGVIPTPIEGYR